MNTHGTRVIIRCELCGLEFSVLPSRASRKFCSRQCRGKSAATHGAHGSRLYRIWNNMHSRCRCESTPSFDLYGGAGIRVCDEWKSFERFRRWAMDNGYAENLSLDRRRSELDYSPDNCRWATKSQQSANTRKPRGLHASQFKGVTLENRRGKRKRWQSQGHHNGKCVFLGLYATETEAAMAYDSWALQTFGAFARLNFQ